MKPPGSKSKVVRLFGAGVGVGLLLLSFGHADWGLVHARLSAAGPSLLLAVLPFALAAVIDVQASRSILHLFGTKLPFGSALRVHLAAEATSMSLPLGAVASDALRAYLLGQRADVEPATGVAATVARKYFLIATEGVSEVADVHPD